MRVDLGFRGLDPVEWPRFVKALVVLGLPMMDLGLEKKPSPGIVDGMPYSLK